MKRIKNRIKFVCNVIRHTETIIKKDINVELENVGNGKMDSTYIWLNALRDVPGGYALFRQELATKLILN